MGWVEVVSSLEHFELEVAEDALEPGGDLAELVGVAQAAEAEVDGTIKARQRIAVEVICPKRLHERADPCGALGHPGRRLPGRWWRELDCRLHVEAHERL